MLHCTALNRAGIVDGAYSFAKRGLFDPVDNLLVGAGGLAHFDKPHYRAPPDHNDATARDCSDDASSIVSIFQINLHVASGDLADYTHTKR